MISIDTLVNLIPQPVKDVIMFPVAVRENTQEAVERFTRSSLRITIAALGVFTTYSLYTGIHSLPGFVAKAILTGAAVYISSLPAGDILLGCGLISGGGMILTIAMNAKTLTLLQIGSNLLEAGMGAGLMFGGVICIHESAKRTPLNGFLGCFEPIINRIAEEAGVVACILVP